MINEILQWMVIIWLIWSIHGLGKAIKNLNDVIRLMIDSDMEKLDSIITKKEKISFEVRLKEGLKKND